MPSWDNLKQHSFSKLFLVCKCAFVIKGIAILGPAYTRKAYPIGAANTCILQPDNAPPNRLADFWDGFSVSGKVCKFEMNGTVWHNIEKFGNIIGELWKHSIKFVGYQKHLDDYALITFKHLMLQSVQLKTIVTKFRHFVRKISIKNGVSNSLFFEKNRKNETSSQKKKNHHKS